MRFRGMRKPAPGMEALPMAPALDLELCKGLLQGGLNGGDFFRAVVFLHGRLGASNGSLRRAFTDAGCFEREIRQNRYAITNYIRA